MLANRLFSERNAPPYFAGRQSELATLTGRLDELLHSGAGTGGLTLLTGVPGVGKTQLGLKYVETATGRRNGVDVHGIVLEPEMLVGEVGLFLAMGDALGCEDAFRSVAEIDTKTTARGGGVGLVKANVTREHVRHTGEFPALLRKSKTAGAWDGKALIVVIDELHTIRPEGAAALRVLHQGLHGCPTLPVGIGLQHLPVKLADFGISRTQDVIRVAPLDGHEAVEAIAKGLSAMGHDVPEQSVIRLAEASFGFPQHIHGYLAGAEVAIEKHGHLESGAALDLAAELGDARRTRYYQARLNVLPNGELSVLPVIAKMLDAGVDRLTVPTAIAEIDKTGLNGREELAAAVTHGVLTSDGPVVSFGIPSFHTHMAHALKAYRKQARAENRGTVAGGE